MFESEKRLILSDLADIKLLQEFQDTFAKAMNVASITVDDKDPITRPSNFTDFCTKYTRGSSTGSKKCTECDIKWGKIAAERGEPVIYKCHTGLTDFAVPIIVAGQHIGTILGGQILTEKPNEEQFRTVAKELGIDEDEYIAALRKVKIVPMENIEASARLLYLVANAISEIGYKNLQLFKKNRTESLYRIIMGSINATINMDETKKRIVNIIGQTLHVDRCFIVEYDKASDKFESVSEEYLSSNSISSYKDIDLNTQFPQSAAMLKKSKPIVVDKKNYSESQKYVGSESDVKATIAVPLHYGNEILGALVVHYIEREHVIPQEEVNLLNATAAQMSAVIYQNKLLKNAQPKSGSSETTVFQLIDKMKDPLMKVNKYAQALHQPLNINDKQHANLSGLNDNLKQLLSIIKEV